MFKKDGQCLGAKRLCPRGFIKTAPRRRTAVHKRLGQASLARIDYAELRDPDTLETAPDRLVGPTLLAIALQFGADPDGRGAPTRLIDNRVLLARSGDERSADPSQASSPAASNL